MWLLKRATPVAVALAIISGMTGLLWVVRLNSVGPQHLVFFYLLPTALVAALYGSLPAMLCAIAATMCAAYFLYDPLYSFYVAKPLEVGELGCFTALAMIGAKCTADLLRPVMKIHVPQKRDAISE